MSSSSRRRSLIRKRTALPAAAVGGVLLLSACTVAGSGEAANGSAGTEGALHIVLAEEPPTLEACDANLTAVGVVVRSNITEPLVERNPTTGDLEPLLATGWEATGEKEWTFTLRPDVTFHDGASFDAEAAAFSIDRAVNSDLACNVEGYVFGDDDLGLEVVDETTLKVTTAQPDPILPLRLSFLEMVSPSTDAADKVREPAGTGPYRIDKWDVGSKLTLQSYEGYWGERPAYQKAEYQWRSVGTVRAAMVTSGEADLAMGLGPEDGAGELGVAYPNNETVALRFSGDIAPLNDIRVRRAINYAIDKEGIVAGLYQNSDVAAAQLVPEGIVGHNPELKPWEFDLDKAKELVAEAKADGVPVDEKITIIVKGGQFPKIDELAQVLQEQISQAGLNPVLKMVDDKQKVQYQTQPFVKNEGAIAVLVQHGNQAGDAAFTVGQYMGSKGAQSTFGTQKLDALIERASQESGEERQRAYEDVFKYQNEEVVQFAHISHRSGVLGKSSKVDYEPNSASGDELRLAEIKPAG
ncbi:ABC transporter substrate-binding protein [Arthrobacter sp. ISL-30]|uniref:ABC transporter substrate-binding protein n=1 Tax=Arthrobacter sp. ISL-30 TaxID=2819109 RepID=UPI002035F629|nr:ABC transporter substrate-binding protein [Arthrobacter sp. ISL-30]